MKPQLRSNAQKSTAVSIAKQADHVILAALAASIAIALFVGWYYLDITTAALVGLPLLAVGCFVVFLHPGSLLSRLILAATLMASVALHIQLARGTLEMHFGVFVTLAFLLIYRDWRPILMAAGVIALHHIGADRMQAYGAKVYCLTEPNFLRVLLHAGYVVVQTGLEVYIALLMRRASTQGHELTRLVEHVRGSGRINLNADSIDVHSPAASELKGVLVQICAAIENVQASVSFIQTASTEIASGSNDLSARTEQAASHLQSTSSAMLQLTSTVQQTAAAASTANQLASGAANVAERGGQVVAEVIGTMDQISDASRRIADIIGVIDGIAFQTNILALNAAVEAARAGEQGRGFAVVAGEVRTLAQRSATAAREIKDLIQTSAQRVELGSRLVQDAGSTMNDIVSSVKRVSDIIEEITTAAREQSEGLSRVNEAVHNLDAATQQNAALAEESSAAADGLRQQAKGLASVVEQIEVH